MSGGEPGKHRSDAARSRQSSRTTTNRTSSSALARPVHDLQLRLLRARRHDAGRGAVGQGELALGKLGLEPGMTLLDIGCGWGSTMRHAVGEYDVNVIGLTLSKNQSAHVQQSSTKWTAPAARRCGSRAGSNSDEPIDRIVSLGAFEHFADGAGDAGYERYDDLLQEVLRPAARRRPHAAALDRGAHRRRGQERWACR